jgi:hypothetical protein
MQTLHDVIESILTESDRIESVTPGFKKTLLSAFTAVWEIDRTGYESVASHLLQAVSAQPTPEAKADMKRLIITFMTAVQNGIENGNIRPSDSLAQMKPEKES